MPCRALNCVIDEATGECGADSSVPIYPIPIGSLTDGLARLECVPQLLLLLASSGVCLARQQLFRLSPLVSLQGAYLPRFQPNVPQWDAARLLGDTWGLPQFGLIVRFGRGCIAAAVAIAIAAHHLPIAAQNASLS